jgi:hypothetical protein
LFSLFYQECAKGTVLHGSNSQHRHEMSHVIIPLSGFASWAKCPAAKPSQVLIVNIKPFSS